jgi:hypothetical protein
MMMIMMMMMMMMMVVLVMSMVMMMVMIIVFDDYVLLYVCTYCTGRRREGLMKFIKFLQDVISGIYIDDSQDDDHIDSDRDSGDGHNDVGRYSEDVVDDYIDVDCKRMIFTLLVVS